MLILISIALLGVGLLLFSLGVAIWLVGLTLRIAIRLFQLAVLIVWVGIAFARWLRQRNKVEVLEGEILPPQRTLSRQRLIKLLLLAGGIALAATMAHADDWRQRAQEAVAATTPPHQPCVLYADRRDNKLHLRVPTCFYNNGDIYTESYEGDLAFHGRKAGAFHAAVPCAETIEAIERIDPATFLVRLYCEHATPQRDAVTVQLIDGAIHIFNTEAF
jgi:hypothetical protein